ncbi:MAG: twin-arginine translocase subunit TatC [Candidatus Hydrogenedentes bacterium]|nr:twin-arginine translocase subunit TatC [Candidatus Hydrogenedentota bacterium]
MSDEVTEDESRMSFTEHLGELRIRLIRSGIAVVAGAVLCYIFSNQIFEVLARPLQVLQAEGTETPWVVLGPLEYFFFKIKVAGYGGMCLAFPVIIYQLCSFIFPGLHPREKRAAQFLLIGCFLLAFAGTMLAYFGVLPFIMVYVADFLPDFVDQQLRVGETISVIVKALIAFGIAFQFPMVVLILVYLGVITPETLKQYRKITIVGLAVGSAMLTPPDPITMTLMLIPLYGLFEASIWASYLVVRRRDAEKEEGE